MSSYQKLDLCQKVPILPCNEIASCLCMVRDAIQYIVPDFIRIPNSVRSLYVFLLVFKKFGHVDPVNKITIQTYDQDVRGHKLVGKEKFPNKLQFVDFPCVFHCDCLCDFDCLRVNIENLVRAIRDDQTFTIVGHTPSFTDLFRYC